MVFNSVNFFLFFILVYLLYLRLNHRGQNLLLLLASYVFYGAWDWRFCFLLLASTLIDFICGQKIQSSATVPQRRIFLSVSIVSNLSILCFFKYFNFFQHNMIELLRRLGVQADPVLINIVLPVGISFYTFQSMSYTIDVYRKEMKATSHFLDFALFLSFFPQLLAGPIERAKTLLPQVLRPRAVTRELFYEGSFLIFWGLFLKVVIAENLAKIVNAVYLPQGPYHGIDVLVATYAFTFQIYCDFAGYSHIARGLAKLMGFELMVNFNLPFFVTNIQDFWNRWHISLSSWLRDYFYLPMFKWMRRVDGNMRIYIALMTSMTLIGLWHGAGWNYIAFGFYYGVLLCIYVLIRMHCLSWINPQSRLGQAAWHVLRMVFMFHLVFIGMMMFRSIEGLTQFKNIFGSLLTNFTASRDTLNWLSQLVFFTWLLFAVQVWQYRSKDLMCVYKAHPAIKTVFYVICLFYFAVYGVVNGNKFIYFQF